MPRSNFIVKLVFYDRFSVKDIYETIEKITSTCELSSVVLHIKSYLRKQYHILLQIYFSLFLCNTIHRHCSSAWYLFVTKFWTVPNIHVFRISNCRSDAKLLQCRNSRRSPNEYSFFVAVCAPSVNVVQTRTPQ